MNKKIKLNLETELMDETNEKSEFPLSLIIKELLKEYNRNKNLRNKISKSLNI